MTLGLRQFKILVPIALFVGLAYTFATTPVETILDVVGINNGYLLVFVLGGIGGLSTFVAIPYHLILMSLSAGGLSPLLLGIMTAAGVMTGDSVMYVLCRNLKQSFPPRLEKTLATIAAFLHQRPRLIAPSLFTYGAVSPFSNDFIIATMSLSGYPYVRTILPLFLGNCVFNISLAYLGLYAYDTIVAWI